MKTVRIIKALGPLAKECFSGCCILSKQLQKRQWIAEGFDELLGRDLLDARHTCKFRAEVRRGKTRKTKY